MRIDAHQHFWRYTPEEYGWIDAEMQPIRRDFLPDDLRIEMDRAGVDAAIAVQVRQSLEETRWLLEIADRHPFVAGVIGWIDLRADDVRAQAEALAAHPKLVGVRHIVQAEPDDRFLLSADFCRGIGVLEELRLPYDLLIYPRHLPAAVDLVSRFDRETFVLDHLAKPPIRSGAIEEWSADLRRLAQAPNVFCKVSGLVTEADWNGWTTEQIAPYLDVAFEAFGPDRLVMGSDWPVCTLAASYMQVVSLVTDYLSARPSAERDGILGGNARRVWHLGPVAGTVRRMQEQSR